MNRTVEINLSATLGWAAEGLFYGLLVFTVFSHGSVEAWSLSVSHLAVYTLLLLFLAGRLAEGGRSAGIPALSVLCLALLVWGAVSCVWFSVYRQATLESLLKLIDYLLIAFFVYNRFGESASQRRFLLAVAVLGGVVAGWGLIRYFAVAQGFFTKMGNESLGATAPFVNHNHFAGFLEMSLAAGAGLFAATWGRVRAERSILLGAGLVLMFVALLFSLSRGGILSLLTAAGLFALVYLAKNRGGASLSPVLALVIFALGYLWVLQTDRVEARLKTLGDEKTMLTLNSRTTAWRSAVAAIQERPLAGYGPGNFASAYPRFRERGLSMFFDYAHNDYLQTWVEYGFFGVLVVVSGLLLYFSGLIRMLLRPWEPGVYIGLGVGAGILALLLHSVADFNLQLHSNAILFVGLAAIFILRIAAIRRSYWRELHLPLRWVAPAVLVLCLAGGWLAVPSLRAGLMTRQARALEQQSPLEAAALYRNAGALVPGDAGYAFRTGHAYAMAAGLSGASFFLEEARSHLGRAIRLNPNYSEYWIENALLEAGRGDSAAAERSFMGALEADPRNPACFFYLSDFLLERGQMEEAIAVSRQGLEIYPGYIGQRLRRVWEKCQDPETVRGLAPSSSGSGHFVLAQHFYNKGFYSQSLAELRLCDAGTKWEKEYFHLSGRGYQALGAADSAEMSYRIGTEKKPPEMQDRKSTRLNSSHRL